MSWIALLGPWYRGRPGRLAARPPAARRAPGLEPLEDRTLPSAAFPGPDAGARFTTGFSGALNDGASTVLAGPDGKVVVVGTAGHGLALARYTATGALDRSFGSGGEVTTTFPGEMAYATDAALGDGGALLVAGYYYNPQTSAPAQAVLLRYNPDGKLDTSFGTGGHVNVLSGTNGSKAFVTVQPDGEVLVAGTETDSGTGLTSFVTQRYTSGGAPDTSFGGGGQVSTPVGPAGQVSGVRLQSDGSIIVGGSESDFSAPATHFVAVRYTTDGTLDTSFGSGGLASIATGQFGAATGLAVGPDDSIVVAGNAVNYNPLFSQTVVAARFTPDGTPDGTFGTGGLASADSFTAGGVAVGPDGSVIIAGTRGTASTQITALRFAPDGTLDTSFGSGGAATTSITGSDSASSVAVLGDGKVVVAGRTFEPTTSGDFAVVRYTNAGDPDAGFGTGGVVTTNFVGQVDAFANSVVGYRGGDYLVAGTTTSGGASLAVARYHSDGTLDRGFGSGGTAEVTFNPSVLGPRSRDGYVAVEKDGRIVLVGTSIQPGTSNYDIALARLLPNGRLDPTFGDGGKVTTFSGAVATELVPTGGVVIQPDGKILVAGYSERRSQFPPLDQGVVIRYNPDGSLDTTFGSGGRSVFTLPSPTNRVTSFALEPDGKVLVGGYVSNPATHTENYFLEQLTSHGVADTTFGTGGQVVTAFAGAFDNGGPLAVGPGGAIFVGGTTFDRATGQDFMTVARFTAAGAPDTGYGTAGRASISFGAGNIGSLSGMTLLPGGEVVAAGTEFTTDPTTHALTSSFAVARFTASGSVDTNFGRGGLATATFSGQDRATGVLVLKGGKIVVAGSTFDPASLYSYFALAEFNPDGSPATGHGHKHHHGGHPGKGG